MKVDLNYLLVIPRQCLGHLTQHPWERYCLSHLGHQPCQCCLSCLGKHHRYSPQSPGKQEVKILSHAWKMCWHAQCRQEKEITQEEIYSTHTTEKVGYVVKRDQPRYI